MKIVLIIFGIGLVLLIGGFFLAKNAHAPEQASLGTSTEDSKINNPEEPMPQQDSAIKNPRIILETNKGAITLELFMNKTPITAGNFIKLARDFYGH